MNVIRKYKENCWDNIKRQPKMLGESRSIKLKATWQGQGLVVMDMVI